MSTTEERQRRFWDYPESVQLVVTAAQADAKDSTHGWMTDWSQHGHYDELNHIIGVAKRLARHKHRFYGEAYLLYVATYIATYARENAAWEDPAEVPLSDSTIPQIV